MFHFATERFCQFFGHRPVLAREEPVEMIGEKMHSTVVFCKSGESATMSVCARCLEVQDIEPTFA